MRQINFEMIDRKLTKKNSELQEVRETRKKLEDKEKAIKSTIEKLQNQKIELIFEQVKKEVRNENIDVSSASILPLLEVLRKNDNTSDSDEESITSAPVFIQNEITPTKESKI